MIIPPVELKKNLNASRPSSIPQSGEETELAPSDIPNTNLPLPF